MNTIAVRQPCGDVRVVCVQKVKWFARCLKVNQSVV